MCIVLPVHGHAGEHARMVHIPFVFVLCVGSCMHLHVCVCVCLCMWQLLIYLYSLIHEVHVFTWPCSPYLYKIHCRRPHLDDQSFMLYVASCFACMCAIKLPQLIQTLRAFAVYALCLNYIPGQRYSKNYFSCTRDIWHDSTFYPLTFFKLTKFFI